MLARHKSSTIDYHFVLLIRLLKELRNGQSGWKDFYCYQSNGASGVHSVRHLRQAGAYVRALTRNPRSKKAKQIAALGAELVTGNMEKPETLTTLFQGATGVYSVQNPYTSSIAAEVQQRKIVAIAANLAGITHFIQASAGLGKKNGVPSWDSKLEIEEYIRSLGLHLTIFRPMAFMELITDSSYYPMVSTFHHRPRLWAQIKRWYG